MRSAGCFKIMRENKNGLCWWERQKPKMEPTEKAIKYSENRKYFVNSNIVRILPNDMRNLKKNHWVIY